MCIGLEGRVKGATSGHQRSPLPLQIHSDSKVLKSAVIVGVMAFDYIFVLSLIYPVASPAT